MSENQFIEELVELMDTEEEIEYVITICNAYSK